jgi:hypothetical protein
MITIRWRYGPMYPMGMQTSAGAMLDGTLVSAGGFTRYPKEITQAHPDAFEGRPTGFTKLAFALDPGSEEAGWSRIADCPGSPRQSIAAVVVDGAMYCIGGFNYTDPKSYRDVVRLQHEEGRWEWETLPCPFPWPVCEALAAAVESRIYVVGGADFCQAAGAGGDDFHSEAGRDGNPVGRALFVLDTHDLAASWRRLADLPGTPRGFMCGGAAGGKIYVLSGLYSPADRNAYFNVVDNWVYDPPSDRWTRLPDMPDAGSNRRSMVFQDRYVIMVGGCKCEQTWSLEGQAVDVYGPEPVGSFVKAVWVFDTQTSQFGKADPLLEQTGTPTVALCEDRLYVWGGEGGTLWHPDSLQVGQIQEVTP